MRRPLDGSSATNITSSPMSFTTCPPLVTTRSPTCSSKASTTAASCVGLSRPVSDVNPARSANPTATVVRVAARASSTAQARRDARARWRRCSPAKTRSISGSIWALSSS